MAEPSVIQIGINRISIQGSEEFVAHMQRIVIGALIDAPLSLEQSGRSRGGNSGGGQRGSGGGGQGNRGGGRQQRQSGSSSSSSGSSSSFSKRRGRLPGRTVNGRYIKPGDPIPSGYREVRGKLVSADGGNGGSGSGNRGGGGQGGRGRGAQMGSRGAQSGGGGSSNIGGGSGRRGLPRGSRKIDGKMYTPEQIQNDPELQRKLNA